MLDLHHLRFGTLRSLDHFRLGLSHPDALLWHALLGLLTGLLTGMVIIGFQLAVEGAQQLMLPAHSENYEGLAAWLRLLLPLVGALLIAGMFFFFGGGIRVLGVANVLERMEYHQGHMSPRGFFLQFFGAAIGIVSGHSVGREGPHVYLGASSGSLLGQSVSAPNSSIRVLVACGTAAAISASFNTPLAGVVFALEVLMLEYSVAFVIPIILAAVSADGVYILMFDSNPTFDVPPFVLLSMTDLLPVVGLSVAAGLLSAAYTEALERIGRAAKPLAFSVRLILAGAIAGVCGLLVPEVMGLGFDSLEALLESHLAWDFLLLLLVVKLISTTASIGLGIPGGTIGPALFMGAVIGNLTAVTTAAITGASLVPASFYVLLGMGAMMGASLLAPLAALTSIVELTHNPGVIMPGMLAIIIAALVSYKGFGKHSLFIAILRANGLDYRADPVLQTLQRLAVGGFMETGFVQPPRVLSRHKAEQVIATQPDWIVLSRDGRPAYLMPGIALASFLSQNPGSGPVDLLDIPGERMDLAPIHLQASLHEALDTLNATGAEALYVHRPLSPENDLTYGILTRMRIETAYRY